MLEGEEVEDRKKGRMGTGRFFCFFFILFVYVAGVRVLGPELFFRATCTAPAVSARGQTAAETMGGSFRDGLGGVTAEREEEGGRSGHRDVAAVTWQPEVGELTQ